MRKTLIILVSGKAGVGKTTFSKNLVSYLEDRYENLKVGIFPFASRLKQIATTMGWDGVKDKKGRSLLQGIGQIGRAYDIDMWVKYTINHTVENQDDYPLDVVLIDDWRFPNELEFVKNNPLYEVVRLRLEAKKREILKDTPEYNEISETALPSAGGSESYDCTIYNQGTMDDFKDTVKNFWEFILDRYEENIRWI